jgi:predicted aspartyl protease
MKLLDYLNLVSDFKGNTIRLPIVVAPVSVQTVDIPRGHQLILDTGADNSALTEEFLMQNGYSNFQKSGARKRTATGEVELLTCEINGLAIAKQFKVSKMKVDVLTGWDEHAVVGVIGMDILSRLTFILSHEHKKFLLSAKPIPELAKLFA